MLLVDIFNVIAQAIQIYMYAIIGYILMSWFPGARESSIGRFLGKIVEPYLEPFRKIIPPLGMIDISPIVAIFTLNFALYGLGELFEMIILG
jgi:YggT family protein